MRRRQVTSQLIVSRESPFHSLRMDVGTALQHLSRLSSEFYRRRPRELRCNVCVVLSTDGWQDHTGAVDYQQRQQQHSSYTGDR